MTFNFLHSRHDDDLIRIPAIGLDLWVRVPPSSTNGQLTIIDTINAPGFGPPVHRHRETEIFRILEGRYRFEVDGRSFLAEAGDVVTVPGGAVHGFVNVQSTLSRQSVLIVPGMDAGAFFSGLAEVMAAGRPDPVALNLYGKAWGVEFMGPPLAVA